MHTRLHVFMYIRKVIEFGLLGKNVYVHVTKAELGIVDMVQAQVPSLNRTGREVWKRK